MVKQKQTFVGYFKERTKSNWVQFAILTLFTAFMIFSCIYFAVLGDVRDVLCSICYFLLIPLYHALEYWFKVRAPFAYVLVMVLFILFSFLGACYNLYTPIRHLDDFLHIIFGMVFFGLGMAIMTALMGKPKSSKDYFIFLLFGFTFALTAAVVWEIGEFTTDRISPNIDSQEDEIVSYLHSFLLHDPYDHKNTLQIEGIDHTILYDANGEILYVIEGGYLDTGILDTMYDIICCTAGSVILFGVLAIDWWKGNKFVYRHFVPQSVVKEAGVAETTVSETVVVSGEADATTSDPIDEKKD
jgi:hypothetical protein